MATVANQPHAATASSRSSSIANGHTNIAHGHADAPVSPASANCVPATPTQNAPTSKKAKGKKPADPNETSKLLAAKISQLELDAAGEKDQELEIGTYWANVQNKWIKSAQRILVHIVGLDWQG